MSGHQSGGRDYGCSRDYTNQAICLWIAPEIESIVTARLAAQAGRVAEVVEKVLGEHPYWDGDTSNGFTCEGCGHRLSAINRVASFREHLAERVAAELEADHG